MITFRFFTQKKPANIRIYPNARRRGNDSLFSLHSLDKIKAQPSDPALQPSPSRR